MRTIMWLALTFSIGCDKVENDQQELTPALQSLEPAARYEVVKALDRLDRQLAEASSARARMTLHQSLSSRFFATAGHIRTQPPSSL